MPTYDYECKSCRHKFELYQPITAKPIRKCPTCGQPKAVRLIGTGGGVIFRGPGFYQTDYRSDAYKKAAKAETDNSGSKAESSSGDKPDNKSGSTDSTNTPQKSDTTTEKKNSTPD